MVRETALGAYLGPDRGLTAACRQVVNDPHFDVFESRHTRLILGKCSRIADDEDPGAGRFGIDFHRALPLFSGDSDTRCDLGEGPVDVNALNFAACLPRALMFREFTANLAFAAATPEAYEQKSAVYRRFYASVFDHGLPLVIAVPHSGDVKRPPDACHPYPQSEIDAWTAGVASRIPGKGINTGHRILVSFHSTDYFGPFMDIGDFGLSQNRMLRDVVRPLGTDFSAILSRIRPDYYRHVLPYTRSRMQWVQDHFGFIDPERLGAVSTAARFEILRLASVVGSSVDLAHPLTLDGLWKGIEEYCRRPAENLITLNRIFSGRKTARLLDLDQRLQASGFATAVQIECSRFLAREYPDVAADLTAALIQKVDQFLE